LGEYDIGSIREGTLDLVKERIDIDTINILAHTSWYPGWVYAVRKDLDKSVVKKIKQALLQLNTKTRQDERILKQAGFSGIISAEDKDFDPVRELAKILERR